MTATDAGISAPPVATALSAMPYANVIIAAMAGAALTRRDA